MLAKGDLEAQAVWLWVAKPIEELLDMEPPGKGESAVTQRHHSLLRRCESPSWHN